MTEGLNDSPKFIEALAHSVLTALGAGSATGSNLRDIKEDRVRERAALSMAAD
jgi:hypothetical protein